MSHGQSEVGPVRAAAATGNPWCVRFLACETENPSAARRAHGWHSCRRENVCVRTGKLPRVCASMRAYGCTCRPPLRVSASSSSPSVFGAGATAGGAEPEPVNPPVSLSGCCAVRRARQPCTNLGLVCGLAGAAVLTGCIHGRRRTGSSLSPNVI